MYTYNMIHFDYSRNNIIKQLYSNKKQFLKQGQAN